MTSPMRIVCPHLVSTSIPISFMIDVLKRVGLGAMAQVDLGTRQNRHQPLRDLSRMSYAVLRAVARRLRQDGRLDQARDPNLPDQLFQFSDFMHAVATPDGLKLQEYVEELVERPPFDDASEVDPGVSRTPAAARHSGDGLVKPRRGDVGGESASVKGVRDDPSSARLVYDPLGQKIGSAEEVFVNREGGPEYIRVRVGLFGMKSVLIPVQFVDTDEEKRTLALQ
jgi:hypothetical protein